MGKDYLQVLDFVAQMHKRYRVDRKFAALLPAARLLSDRTWTQWKAAAGIVPAPADQDLAILAPAVARACQITAPGYLGAIKALPASGLSLVGEDSAAANMLYSLLWGERGELRGLETIQQAFQRLAANPSVLADLREVAAYQMDVTQCAGHKPYPLPLELHGGVALGTFPRPRCTRTTP